MTDERPQKRHRVRWFAAGTAGLLVAALLGYFWLRRSGQDIGTAALTRLVETSFDRLAAGRYVLSIDSLTADRSMERLDGFGIVIEAVPDTTVTENLPFRIDLPHLYLTGAKPFDLARGRLPEIGALVLERPSIRLGPLPSSGDSARAQTPQDLIAVALHGLRLDSLLLRDMTIVIQDVAPALPDTITEIRLCFSGLRVDSTRTHADWPSLFSEDVALHIRKSSWLNPAGLYEITAGPLRISTATGTARLDTFAIQPVTGDSQLNLRRGHRGGRYRLAVGPAILTGLETYRLIETGDVFIETATVNDFDIDYLEDARPPPGPPRVKWQPQRWAASLDRTFNIDTLRLTAGKVLYERFAPDGTMKGRLPFRRMYATAYHLNNLTGSDDSQPISQLDVITHIAGTGKLDVHFELDLASPAFDMRYNGRFGPMTLEPLNDFLVPTEGLRIRSGHVDYATFTVNVNDGIATGVMDARYEELHIVEVNKESGRSRLTHRLRSFLLNTFRLKSSNLDTADASPRRGVIEHSYTDTETFLHFLWFSTRSGIFSITGLED